MKFENIRVHNFENAMRGMRNPKESWNLSDSYYGFEYNDAENIFQRTHGQDYEILHVDGEIAEFASIGPNDMKLAQTLIRGGSEHRKFMREIVVSVDITAPLYWWKEADTYKVGTVANSTSTMHKIQSKSISVNLFETDDYNPHLLLMDNSSVGENVNCFIEVLEQLRKLYLKYNKESKNENHPEEDRKNYAKLAKMYWKELIRWTPEAWMQTRTMTMTYENLLAMCSRGQRRFHKLTEWSGDGEDFIHESFIKFARSLPYAQEFIFIDEL